MSVGVDSLPAMAFDPLTCDTLSLAQARRVALAAQGFADRPPGGAPDRRHLRRVLDRVALIQVDSVNVLQRAHYLPAYSRLGPYRTDLLDRAAYRAPRDLFEYWGHEASLVPVDLQPFLRWRMAAAHESAWGGMRRIAGEQPELVKWVLDEVREKGPLTAAEIEHDAPRETGNWGWNWSAVKRALEWLFWSREVHPAGGGRGGGVAGGRARPDPLAHPPPGPPPRPDRHDRDTRSPSRRPAARTTAAASRAAATTIQRTGQGVGAPGKG